MSEEIKWSNHTNCSPLENNLQYAINEKNIHIAQLSNLICSPMAIKLRELLIPNLYGMTAQNNKDYGITY
jgi:hypothetical protein